VTSTGSTRQEMCTSSNSSWHQLEVAARGHLPQVASGDRDNSSWKTHAASLETELEVVSSTYWVAIPTHWQASASASDDRHGRLSKLSSLAAVGPPAGSADLCRREHRRLLSRLFRTLLFLCGASAAVVCFPVSRPCALLVAARHHDGESFLFSMGRDSTTWRVLAGTLGGYLGLGSPPGAHTIDHHMTKS
jgi:hypothetical protein